MSVWTSAFFIVGIPPTVLPGNWANTSVALPIDFARMTSKEQPEMKGFYLVLRIRPLLPSLSALPCIFLTNPDTLFYISLANFHGEAVILYVSL